MPAIRITVNEPHEHWVYTCDFCGVELSSAVYPPHPCCICGRYSCRDHGMDDPPDSSDYPDRYCRTCWDAGKPFRDRMAKIQRAANAEIEAEQDKWQVAARLQTTAKLAAEQGGPP